MRVTSTMDRLKYHDLDRCIDVYTKILDKGYMTKKELVKAFDKPLSAFDGVCGMMDKLGLLLYEDRTDLKGSGYFHERRNNIGIVKAFLEEVPKELICPDQEKK